jgi:hypothetical protein
MRESDEPSQCIPMGDDGSIASPAEAHRMWGTKALPYEVALLTFVPYLKRKSARLIIHENALNPVFTGKFYIIFFKKRERKSFP